jgi:Ca2+:H+ antiporter
VIFVPVTIALEILSPDRYLLIFITSSLAILPLAKWMGGATEHLATHFGEGVGGLLNATFGNAAELIIAFVAMRAGLNEVVKASIAGAFIGNLLLVLGAAMLAGGLRHQEQHFNAIAARSQATMLVLAAIALLLPACFQAAVGTPTIGLGRLSISISIILIVVYLLSLIFALVTHRRLFAGSSEPEKTEPQLSKAKGICILAGATVGIACMSEILVGTIEPATHALGLNTVFVGVFVVAVMGNAVEHATAIFAAMKNRMDLSLSIAIGSSVQIALFVAPLLVISSLFVSATPLDLAFSPGLILLVLLSVLITAQVANDGRSDWLEGVQLLAIYLVLGITLFFVPADLTNAHPP